ncbi:hypothetical protein PIB30_045553 [Stylosanthes scabra]|uniref:Uncharacterized protein n=1 Tax=Stylosanthes scabra TaxID=79078 RepID=A0ABU6VEI9_9FABA|nr:hypothetical protein [Stylosanthes scabra]
MRCQVSIFEVRRCTFGDKPYGVAESYSREGVDVEVNSPRRPEIGLWDSRLHRIFPILHDSPLLVGHLLAALFLKNRASRLVRNIAPTQELEAFGPSLRVMNFLDIFRVAL